VIPNGMREELEARICKLHFRAVIIRNNVNCEKFKGGYLAKFLLLDTISRARRSHKGGSPSSLCRVRDSYYLEIMDHIYPIRRIKNKGTFYLDGIREEHLQTEFVIYEDRALPITSSLFFISCNKCFFFDAS